MQLERVNDNQIKCILSQEDLLQRNLRITELAYGTEKAKGLFRDMVQKASYELGFEAENVPLMIEAIPTNPGSLTLLISKVGDTNELDPRYSTFTTPAEKEEPNLSNYNFVSENEPKTGTYGVGKKRPIPIISPEEPVSHSDTNYDNDSINVFVFNKLDDLINASSSICANYFGYNTVYKDEKRNEFYLVLHKSEHTISEFNKICNILNEYGKTVNGVYASDRFYEEHFSLFLKNNAVKKLGKL